MSVNVGDELYNCVVLQSLSSILNMDLISEKTGEEIAEVRSMDSHHFLVSLLGFFFFLTPFFLLSALDEIFLHQGHSQRRHPSELRPPPTHTTHCTAVQIPSRVSDGLGYYYYHHYLISPGCRL